MIKGLVGVTVTDVELVESVLKGWSFARHNHDLCDEMFDVEDMMIKLAEKITVAGEYEDQYFLIDEMRKLGRTLDILWDWTHQINALYY